MVQVQQEIGAFERLATPYFAARTDPRFGYFLYVPSHFSRARAAHYTVLVAVHGTGRTAETYRNLFADFAEAHHCLVLAPLFGAALGDPVELNNYKFLAHAGVRYDRVLLDMVEEVAGRYGARADRFLLHGFSGGAHFAHRFFYLHPQRLAGVSVGAPGMVTLLDFETDWHCGLRDAAARFGIAPDVSAMADVPVHMVVGDEDTDSDEILIERSSPLWMEGVNAGGSTRIARLAALRDSFLRHGVAVRHELVPGVGHEGYELLRSVKRFFRDVLAGRRDERALNGIPEAQA